jgi:hypothetical protein
LLEMHATVLVLVLVTIHVNPKEVLYGTLTSDSAFVM